MFPGVVPVVPNADDARAAARRELTDPAYRSHQPTLFERITDAVIDRLGSLFHSTAGAAPGGRWSLVLLLAVAGGLGLALRARLGRLAGAHRRAPEVFGGTVRAAAEHHAAADAALVAGDLDTAVRERFRALVRGLEERGLLEPRPGYTANEAAADAGRLLAPVADGLRAAARVFDEVRFGGRTATRAGHDTIAATDAAARTARPDSSMVAAAGSVQP